MPRDPELYPSDAEYYEDPYYNAWDVVYRYQGTIRSAKIHSDYRPTNGETKRHLEEIHND